MRQKKAKAIRRQKREADQGFAHIEETRAAIPCIDVRTSPNHRKEVEARLKETNGNMSSYIPAKWGYGPMGGKKY